jgi:Tol biopolymer transport system component
MIASTTPFGPPQLVAGIRSDTDDVQDPALSDDELEIFFTSPTGGINDIWSARRAATADPWGAAAPVAELSSAQDDEDPELSADGLTIMFASDRAGDGVRLYVATRLDRDQPWGAPQPVLGLGTSVLDRAPALDGADLQLVFASQRGTAEVPHLYAATRADAAAGWTEAVELTAINSAWQDVDPALFAAGRGLIFASRRAGGGQTSDLFETVRASASAPFDAAPRALGELNSGSSEGDPWVSQDGRHLLFVSDRNGRSRIYETRR